MLKKLLNLFGVNTEPSVTVNVGDIGIYQDVIAHYSEKTTKETIKNDVFVKVKVTNVYKDLVEIEVLQIDVLENAHPFIVTLAETSIGKYLNPKQVKWQCR
jgi:hypothetical protein